jgi:hypothetical protein
MEHKSPFLCLSCCFLCVSLFLVDKVSLDICFHTHTATDSTWLHAQHVAENIHTTPKQAKRNNALVESSLLLSHSCGALRTALPT